MIRILILLALLLAPGTAAAHGIDPDGGHEPHEGIHADDVVMGLGIIAGLGGIWYLASHARRGRD